MSELPPFAQALLQRRSAPSSPFSRTMNSPTRFQPFNETSETSLEISALEHEISDLTSANRELASLRKQLDSEREKTTALGREYDLLAASVAEEEAKLRATNEQIEQIRSLIDSKETIINAKTDAIEALQREYLTLQGEYRRALSEFEDQASGVKTYRPAPVSPRRTPPPRPRDFDSFDSFPEPPPSRNTYDFDDFPKPRASPAPFDDFPNPRGPPPPFDDFPKPQVDDFPPPREFELPVGVDRTPKYDFGVHRQEAEVEPKPWLNSPVELRMFTRPVTSSPVHAALRDNISFGDDPPPEINDSISFGGMTVEEMKEKMKELQSQKDKLEAVLNRSPPKNVPAAEARRERQQTQEEFDFVVQNLNKIRLELRRIKAL